MPRNSSSYNLVKLLLDKGADINCGGLLRWTPLTYAIKWKKLENVKLLLDRGADLEKTDKNGKTFLVLLVCCRI